MYHSITFGDKNTWDDWHLVPKTRPVFSPPALKEKYLDVPGADGAIDLSESLTGYPLYKNREGSFEFIVMNDYKEWQEAYSDISDYIHGRKMKAVLEDDSDYYYEGRFTVNAWKSDKDYSTITINYNVSPYKRRQEASVVNISVSTENVTKKITDEIYGRAPLCPVIFVNSVQGFGLTVRFINRSLNINVSKTLYAGEQKVPEFVLYGESVTFTVDGTDEILSLEDSSGEPIRDSGNNAISCQASGAIDIICEYGRL